jgi:hypothetical protein
VAFPWCLINGCEKSDGYVGMQMQHYEIHSTKKNNFAKMSVKTILKYR